MFATAEDLKSARHTYDGWTAHGRQVKRGERRGLDGKFGYGQTKAKSAGRGPRVCARCGGRINYGVYCGKCEFGR